MVNKKRKRQDALVYFYVSLDSTKTTNCREKVKEISDNVKQNLKLYFILPTKTEEAWFIIFIKGKNTCSKCN